MNGGRFRVANYMTKESPTVQSLPGSNSLLHKILRAYQGSSLRGRTLLTLLLARRLKSLQAVSIQIADWPLIYMDMRYMNAHSWFAGTPFQSSPHEVNEQAVMRRFVEPGSLVFDIGVNLGLHTVLLSQLAGPNGRVVAFEPNVDVLPLLELTIKGLSNTKLFACALSDENEESTLFVPDDHSMASLVKWKSEKKPSRLSHLFGVGHTREVSCSQRRLDELLSSEGIPPPDFIKCDVEGAELKVFKGARNTLDRPDAPFILFEAGAESARGFDLKVSDAADFLTSLPQAGYQFLALNQDGSLHRIRAREFLQDNQNILAVPLSKRERCPELLDLSAGDS